ncbi:conserved hypothetical protein [Aminomonas paucivorans DSM 12260]|uniref:Uncharacterized protein n=1 Tax=Aminomonas paucivorans DSM 12260 TaxID=584708 RepID=E3CY15_9BACT|nr:hypothetical protein [Aminomonas paucivorans]EFQ24502.1 conserved hypothetical protein [Aminomonas paucivorans DSM 12260]
MDRAQPDPKLEADRAKARFLEAAQGADPLRWAGRHPWFTLGGSLAAGFAAGRGLTPGGAVRLLLRLLTW